MRQSDEKGMEAIYLIDRDEDGNDLHDEDICWCAEDVNGTGRKYVRAVKLSTVVA